MAICFNWLIKFTLSNSQKVATFLNGGTFFLSGTVLKINGIKAKNPCRLWQGFFRVIYVFD
jgi:hypothetical protein